MEPDSIDKSTVVLTPFPEGTTYVVETGGQAPIHVNAASTPLTSTTPTPKDGLDAHESPKITHALEALLGGLTSPSTPSEAILTDGMRNDNTTPEVPLPEAEVYEGKEIRAGYPAAMAAAADPQAGSLDTTTIKDPRSIADAAVATESLPALEPVDTEIEKLISITEARTEDTMSETLQIANPSPRSADIEMGQGDSREADKEVLADNTSALRNAMASIDSVDAQADNEMTGESHPEWEVDSSPIESSSDESSDESSEDSEEGDDAYQLLTPEEQARILMAGDGGSDDESASKSKGIGSQLRTKNEVPEVVIPKPDVEITFDMPLVELGTVETIVENIALIKGKTSGEYRVLESGSILCLEDRSVVGCVAETLGRVQQPLYSVLFTNAASVTEAGLSLGRKIFYTEQHATYVFTQALKAFKGSDASNLHDEEVGDEEMEFSDDEAELEHKRRAKQKKNERNGTKPGSRMNRGQISQQRSDPVPGLSYDDNEDGPYKPLARPAGLAYSIGHGEAPQEGSYSGQAASREPFRDRGRVDRGRGRAARGRGRGAQQNRAGSNGYSQQHQSTLSQQDPRGPALPHYLSQSSHPPQMHSPINFFNGSQQYPPSQPQVPAWPQFLPQAPFPQQQQQHLQQQQQQQPYLQPGFQQTYQNMHQMQGAWPPRSSGPANFSGAFINPSFFGNPPAGGENQQYNHEGRQNREGQ